MAFFHPLVMVLVTLAAGYALFLGLARFTARHLGRAGRFPWKRHVLAGRVSQWGLLVGAAAGLSVTGLVWGSPGVTGAHLILAAAIAPLAGFALLSGALLDGGQGGRELALAHGLVNMLLAGLLACQAWLGVEVLLDFVF